MTAWNVIRLFLALGCLLIASLAITKAPNILLFQVKLGATEYGQWFAIAPLALILAGRRKTGTDTAAVAVAVLAIMLFLSSAFRASVSVPAFARAMDSAFPVTESSSEKTRVPFSWRHLWSWRTDAPVDVHTLEFAEHDGQRMELDFFSPEAESAAPCVVVLHTGGWDRGRRQEFYALNHYLARRGYGVAAIDYRLAPRWKWPAQRDDVLAAIRLLQRRSEELGISPKNFVLLGRSAGGQIAEAVAMGANEPSIRGCIGLYAPADLHFAFKYADAKDILNSAKLLQQYLGGSPEEVREAYDSGTANLHVKPGSVPTLLIHGRGDELVWYKQSERFATRLREANVPHGFLALPWATHAFDHNFNGPGGQVGSWAIERFLASVTAGDGTRRSNAGGPLQFVLVILIVLVIALPRVQTANTPVAKATQCTFRLLRLRFAHLTAYAPLRMTGLARSKSSKRHVIPRP